MTEKSHIEDETIANVPLTTPLKNFVFKNSTFKNMTFQASVSHVKYIGCRFEKVTWTDLNNSLFRECTFEEVTFPTLLKNLSFQACTLKNCHLRGRTFLYLKMSQTTLSACCLNTCHIKVFQLDRCVFRACSIRHATFNDGKAYRTWFASSQFHHSNVIDCKLWKTKFRQCNLNMTKFGCSTLTKVEINKSTLQRSAWCGVSGLECSVRHSNLTHCTMMNVEWQTSTFHHANMCEVSARKCQFFDTSFVHVNWSKGILRDVDMVHNVEHDVLFQDTSFTNVQKQRRPTIQGSLSTYEPETADVRLVPYIRGRALPLEKECWSQENAFSLAVSRVPDFIEVIAKGSWIPYSRNPQIKDVVRYVELGHKYYYYTMCYTLPGGGVKEGYQLRTVLQRCHSI